MQIFDCGSLVKSFSESIAFQRSRYKLFPNQNLFEFTLFRTFECITRFEHKKPDETIAK